MKFIKSIISVAAVCSGLTGLCTVSYAGGVNSAANGVYLDGSNIIADEGVTVTKADTGFWQISEENMTAEDKMEFSLYAVLPEDGVYKLEIASSEEDSIYINGAEVSLPNTSATSEGGLNTYNIRNAEFVRGTNEIKFSVDTSSEAASAEFILSYVKITAYTEAQLSGTEYSYHTNDKWVEEKTVDLSAYGGSSAYKYQSYNSTKTSFYAEYTFYVDEEGRYSLTGVMSYPEESGLTDTRYYSTASILWDGFEVDCDVSSDNWGNMFGKSVYSGLMLEKGMHTLTIIPSVAANGNYNLYVGDLALTKTGDYVNTAKKIEISGNEYTSLGGMTIEEKNDLTLVSSGTAFNDWKLAKSGMSATDTDTVTYSFDVPKAGYYSFEGWINSNSSRWVSGSAVKIDGSELSMTEDTTVTVNSKNEGFYIAKKTISNTEPKLWLNEGTHILELVISPRTSDNAQINARIWKFIFTLMSEDDVYIPALNYEGTSTVIPSAVTTSTFGEASEAIEYYSFKDDSKNDALVLTYKFTPAITAEYTFEGYASAVYSYLSEPVFYLDETQMDTKEDTDVTSSDGFVRRHSAEGIELTAGKEYTLKVEFQPKATGGNINAKLWKMTFNREKREAYRNLVVNNSTLKGSFYVKPQEQTKKAYIIYAQYGEDKRLDGVEIENFELKQSDKFSAASFAVDLPADFESASQSKLFIITTELCPLFDVLELK